MSALACYNGLCAAAKPVIIDFIRNFTSSRVSDKRLRGACLHLLGLGKLVRPMAVVASARAFSPAISLEDCLHTAAAMEFIHTFTLIHDDLPELDNAKLRRNVPAVHIEYGADIGILAGDGLFNLAFTAIAEDPRTAPELRSRLLLQITSAVNQVIEGQARELALSGKPVSLADIEGVQRQKTGELFACSLASGAMLGGASDEGIKAISNFALLLGNAFQIMDDLLSATGNSGVVGKSLEQDEALERPTIVRLLGVDGAWKRYEEINAACASSLSLLEGKADTALLQGLHESLVGRKR